MATVTGGDVSRRNLGLLFAGQLLATTGMMALVPLLPFYLQGLAVSSGDGSPLWAGLALAAPAVSLFFVAPLWGYLSDRRGRKAVVVSAFVGFSASMLAMAVAKTPLVFLLGRLLQGASGLVVALTAFVGAHTPASARGRALGGLQSAAAAGALVGPVIGGLMASTAGLRAVLLATGIAASLFALLAALTLRETSAPDESDSSAPARRWSRSPRPKAMILAGVFAQAGAYGLVVVFFLHVRDLAGSPARAATWTGLLHAATWATTMIGAPWWGKRNDGGGARTVLVASAGCAASIALQAFVCEVVWLTPFRIAQGFFFAAIMQSAYLAVTAHSRRAGIDIGVASSLFVVGQIAGSLASGALSLFLPPRAVVLFMAGFFAVAALCAASDRRLAQEKRLGEKRDFEAT